MFENENKNHKKLILTPYYQFKVDISCFNKQFLAISYKCMVQFCLSRLGFKDIRLNQITLQIWPLSVRNGPSVIIISGISREIFLSLKTLILGKSLKLGTNSEEFLQKFPENSSKQVTKTGKLEDIPHFCYLGNLGYIYQ